MMNPAMWDLHAVVRRITTMVGMGSVDELFAPPQPGPQPQADPKLMTAMMQAQAKAKELAQRTQDSQQKGELQILAQRIKSMSELVQLQNSREERESRERIEGAKIDNERMQLAEAALVHPLATPVAQNFAQLWPAQMHNGGRII
jgi:Na+-transporting methylmalonyl-CoA/oxaloacetate decarboxylase gamma subunit